MFFYLKLKKLKSKNTPDDKTNAKFHKVEICRKIIPFIKIIRFDSNATIWSVRQASWLQPHRWIRKESIKQLFMTRSNTEFIIENWNLHMLKFQIFRLIPWLRKWMLCVAATCHICIFWSSGTKASIRVGNWLNYFKKQKRFTPTIQMQSHHR